MVLELEARLVQSQQEADEQLMRARRRGEDAEGRLKAASTSLEAHVRELEGRLNSSMAVQHAAEEAAAAAQQQLLAVQEEAAAASKAAQAAAVAAAQAQAQASAATSPQVLLYDDVAEATNSFDEENVVGSGGFGVVYRGSPVAATAVAFGPVAVKVLSTEANRQVRHQSRHQSPQVSPPPCLHIPPLLKPCFPLTCAKLTP